MNKNDYIIEAIKAGNEKVFQAFYRSEFNNLTFFIFKYLNQYLQSQDIAQDSFIAFWEYRKNLSSKYNVRSFLYTIARNKALNYLRDNLSKRGTSLENNEILLKINMINSDSVTNHIETIELSELINRVYNILPEEMKSSFTLSRMEELTYKEIAEKQDISVRKVEYNISSALKIFKKNLKEYL